MEDATNHNLLATQAHSPENNSYQSILVTILKIALEQLPLKSKIERILDYLVALEQLGLGPRAAMFLIDLETQTLNLVNYRGFPKDVPLACDESRYGSCHCATAIATGTVQFYNSPPPLALPDSSRYFGNYSVPIIKDDQPLGVLCLYVTHRHVWSLEQSDFLEAVGNILAIIIESQQMDQQLILLVNDLRSSIINLREEKKFSESVIQGLNHGLIVADLDGRIRKSNSVAQAIFKPFTVSLDGHYLTDFLEPAAALQLLSSATSEPGQLDKELTLITPAKETRIIGYCNVPREDARGNKVGVIISLSDISELKYVRKEMEKMNRLSTVAEIASAVAHEVRNPLAGIKIMAQSIEEESKDHSEQLECAQRIIRQVDRLNELLSDFFSYARPAEPNKRPTSLKSIVAETKPLINNRLIKNHITLSEDIGDALPNIIADPHQVQQVFLNLFLNAIDAIREQGHIAISASLLAPNKLQFYKKKHPALLGDGRYIIFHFTDNGAGMSPKVAEQVFEPFFTTKSSGAGLGLSIVYRTLKENDAAIVLDSKEGKGTTFTIFFRAED